MRSKRSQEGYLLIDHRESPGVSAELVHQSGTDAPVVGKNATFESATITCSHCQAVVILNPLRTRARGYCASCDHYVCDSVFCNQGCRSFKKMLADLYDKAVLVQGKESAHG